MPVDWRLQVLEEGLRRAGHTGFTVVVDDLGALDDAERHAVLDAMLEMNGALPVTLVNGVAACVGDIDIAAISARVAECCR